MAAKKEEKKEAKLARRVEAGPEAAENEAPASDDKEPSPPAPQPAAASRPRVQASFPIVGIGASAGGLEALEEFFTNLSPTTGMAFVVVVHLSPDHQSHMAKVVQLYTQMPVYSIEDGQPVRPNCVYIIVPDKDVGLLHNRLQLLEPEAPRGSRAPIDFFFRTLAQEQGQQAIGIILSGTGTNGTIGLKAIKGMGGLAIVQKPDSARYDGMPRSAIATRLVDFILRPATMPASLYQYLNNFGSKLPRITPILPEADPNSLQKIFLILRDKTGHDFSNYKMTTIKRRLERRMTVQKIDNIPDYVRFLTQNQAEMEALFREFLIGVTNFFRDPKAFEVLKAEVLPRLLADKADKESLRIWVPACSTGEEAYSLAIILKEFMQEQEQNFNLKIYATDINDEAITAARWGAFADGIVVDVSQERLERFFVQKDNLYRISQEIREMIIFAAQSVLKDPPLSRLDLISCRNMLIYLNETAQQKVLKIFHYSLRKEGFLFLGTSETQGKLENLFVPFNNKWKIFQRVAEPSSGRRSIELYGRPGSTVGKFKSFTTLPTLSIEAPDGRQLAERTLLEAYTPAAVLVDKQGQASYFHGDTNQYLKPPVGESPFNIISMARPDLKLDLRMALREAVRKKTVVVYENLQVKNNGETIPVRLTVRPVRDRAGTTDSSIGWLLVVFESNRPSPPAVSDPKPAGETADAGTTTQELKRDLQRTEARLQATIENLEDSNEDARSVNEELQAANEELQSINEELETSQEELQSTNEELVTLNANYQHQIDELTRHRNDIHNLLLSTQIATIFLDMELCIKFYTPLITRFIKLIPSDTGRPLEDLDLKLNYHHLIQDAARVLKTLLARETEVQDEEGRWYNVRLLPYRTTRNKVDGVVITFLDITSLKERELQQGRIVFLESVVATVREPLLVLDSKLRIVSANRAFHQAFGFSSEELKQEYIYSLGQGQWDIPRLRELLEQIIPRDNSFEDFEIEYDFPSIGRRTLHLNARRLLQGETGVEMIFLAFEDMPDNESGGA